MIRHGAFAGVLSLLLVACRVGDPIDPTLLSRAASAVVAVLPPTKSARFENVSRCVGDAHGLEGTVIISSALGDETRAKFVFSDGKAMVDTDPDATSTAQRMAQLADWAELEDDCEAPATTTTGS
jgi:hypothetical protein